MALQLGHAWALSSVSHFGPHKPVGRCEDTTTISRGLTLPKLRTRLRERPLCAGSAGRKGCQIRRGKALAIGKGELEMRRYASYTEQVKVRHALLTFECGVTLHDSKTALLTK